MALPYVVEGFTGSNLVNALHLIIMCPKLSNKIVRLYRLMTAWPKTRLFSSRYNNNNNNNNKHDNVYGAVIMAEPLREVTRFI